MSKVTIVDNDLLKSEIRALNNYVNRDEYNLNVVEVMVNEIQDIVKGLNPCEKTTTSGYVNTDDGVESPSYETSINIAHINNDIFCPNCGGSDVVVMYGKVTLDGKPTSTHYVCNKCHKEFDVKE